ncbi:MAG TPA: hypothetical protein DDW87_12885 [Firmicutes bacterium]|nr:hypothetical protein [Bacillota bacterium]
MSARIDAALKLFQGGFNCAQAVAGAFYPVEEDEGRLAVRLASGFGGGMRSGEVCGAVTGAVMVIGLREGYLGQGLAAKAQSSELTSAFMGEYLRRKGTLLCRELLGYDPTDPEAKAKSAAHKRQVCKDAIKTAVLLLQEMGIE